MRKTFRSITIVGLIALLAVASVGTAFALDTTEETPPDLETVKEKVVDRLATRIDKLNEKIDQLSESDSERAAQLAETLTEVADGYRGAIAAIPNATSVDEVRDIVRSANEGVRDAARVRAGYNHVKNDLAKFGRRLVALRNTIERAENGGFDVTRAVAHAGAAADDLAEAQRVFDSIDPSMTGPEVVETIKAAHRKAHEAQQHIRAGFLALKNATLDTETG